MKVGQMIFTPETVCVYDCIPLWRARTDR